MARTLSGAIPDSTSPFLMMASHAAGDGEALKRRFQNAHANVKSSEHARKAAEVALAAEQADWADTFLHAAASSPHAAATTARRRWYAGDMNGAVQALEGRPGNMAKQQRRLSSELSVFEGWRPSLKTAVSSSRNNRVLHLLTNSLPHTGSGYARRTHSILTAQQAVGWETLAVTRIGYPVQIGVLTAKDTDVVDGVTYQRLLPGKMAKTMDGRLQQQTEGLLAVARDFKPSVIHTTTHFVNGLVAGEVAHAIGVPWVYEVRGQLADTWASTRGAESRNSERYQLFMEREAETMRRADLVVTLGEAMKHNIVAAGIPEEKVLISPNAVGGDYFSVPMSQQDARGVLGLDAGLLYVGTVSSLVDYEGIDDLVTAFALLAPRLPRLRLLLVGDGTSAPALRTQVQRLGLAGKVVFTGRVPAEQAKLYHQALDVFVVPRKDLSVTRSVTPLKPVEALACARPVVASRLEALCEIVHDGVTGRLAEPSDPVGLSEVLLELLEDEGLRKRLGAAGRQDVLATRTWSANAHAYAQAYSAAISNHNRKAS
ncbi:glycosyltransferase involved in cell wall biosynthesis [Paenarthrobacter nitroguajacolicus]|nr:glycosyltransferase involved in cell wall biosynthesis [Paenarthrobacter nitroguajacolicus]